MLGYLYSKSSWSLVTFIQVIVRSDQVRSDQVINFIDQELSLVGRHEYLVVILKVTLLLITKLCIKSCLHDKCT